MHRLISSKDLAARLGVSQATVSRAVARGLLRPAVVTPGGHRRFDENDLGGPQNGLVTSSQAARLLGVSQPTLNRAVRKGRLVATVTTPGGHRRFDRASLLAERKAEQ
ncbi:MAG TPA: helix-turn-helix domain-containing protein [Candidatus Dormibacteraeota bacterium]|nr:helix-turn-helix domain-containing protein [Candidatus Dormibacteraeota bacterium]